jgi:uncharacterized delta-60 repeat protein
MPRIGESGVSASTQLPSQIVNARPGGRNRSSGWRRRALPGVVLLAIAAATAASAAAAPGDLDPSFGTGGKVTTDFGPGSNRASSIAVQADGRILAGGTSGSGRFALARYDAVGSLDGTFGTGGMVTTDVGGLSAGALALAIQPDGRIVAAGATDEAGYCCQFALVRYNADGTLDTSFGTDGRVTTDFGGLDEAHAVVVQPDGKILAAGSTYSPFLSGFALARYNPDGSLDAGFGSGGKVTTSFGGIDGAGGLVLQPDGRIVAAGGGGPPGDFALARYNADGSLDTGFGSGGRVTTDFGSSDRAEDVVLQRDGRIVAAGTGDGRFALARYDPDGSLDGSFGDAGSVTTVIVGQNVESATGLAIQSDGRLVAAGWAYIDYVSYFALVRHHADGSLDTHFGDGGKVTTGFGASDQAEGVAIQADGKILAAGFGNQRFALARYLPGPPNHAPDCGSSRASVPEIWPPDHRWVPIQVLGVSDPDGDPVAITVTGVTQDEPLAGRGASAAAAATPEDPAVVAGRAPGFGDEDDGENACSAAVIDPSGGVRLRAERSGRGNGRVYTISFTASDGQGGASGGSVQVCVPHDRLRLACVADRQTFNSLGPCPGRGHGRRLGADGVPADLTLTAATRSGPTLTLEYALPEASDVSIAVYDIAGRRVVTLERTRQGPGAHTVAWNTLGVARGMYFWRLQAGARRVTKSVLVLD